MKFVATSLPGLAGLLSDELRSLGVAVMEEGKAHVGYVHPMPSQGDS